MAEAVDSYADSFMITLGPYGANVSFYLSEPHPSSPGTPPPPIRVATVRMSIEHAKTIVIVMKRHIQQFEEQTGVRANVAPGVLNQLGVGLEDWETFWKNKP